MARSNDKSRTAELPEGILIGRNPVLEALKSGREITKLIVLKDAEGSIKKILGMARDRNIPVQSVERAVLDRAAYGGQHQGVIAHVSDFEYSDVSDILERAAEKNEPPFIIILDGIEDPHNLGAVIRTADAAGAHGVIIPKRRAAAVTATAEKAAAGAASYVPVARVTNISQTIEELKKAGVWIAAVDMDGTPYTKADFTGAIAFVTGSEGSGISRLVKEKCDFCVSIPMKGGVNSLNASNAAAVLMYETVRQRG
jgi:23S rRNA (guanosine2251-2'-O)-methyltransferase